MFKGLVPFGKGPRDIEQLFDAMFEDFNIMSLSNHMKVDIMEKDNELIVEAEIPGVSKEQIHINYHNEYLTISVEDRQEYNEERENYIRKERKIGRSSRTLYVGNVREEGITAKYDNGILKLRLPKTKEIKSKKKIDVQ